MYFLPENPFYICIYSHYTSFIRRFQFIVIKIILHISSFFYISFVYISFISFLLRISPLFSFFRTIPDVLHLSGAHCLLHACRVQKRKKTAASDDATVFALAEKEGLGLACGLGPGSALTCHRHVIHSLAASHPSFWK